jgi:DNA polymerase-3 subunit beta
MKFKIRVKDLQTLFSSVSRAVNPRPSIPSLQGIYLLVKEKELILIGSDLDIVIKGKREVEVDVEGACLINARIGSEVIRKLPAGEVILSDLGEELRIETESLSFNLRKLDEKQYPQELIEDKPLKEEGGSFQKEEFFEAINQVGVAAAQEGSKPILTGILFDTKDGKTSLVSTDSYRLATKELKNFSSEKLGVVSKKALNEVVRLFEESEKEVKLLVEERQVFFDDGNYQVSLRKIEGEYPKYKELFPKETVFSIETEKEKILEALDRSSVVAEGYIPIKLSFSKGSLIITSVNQDIGGGKEEVSCNILGVDVKEIEKFEMSFNPTYLMEAIGALFGNKVYLRFSGNQKPLLIQGETDGYKHLLMPVRSS